MQTQSYPSTHATLLRTAAPQSPTPLSRLKAGLSCVLCDGGPVFAEQGFAANDLIAARRGDIRAFDCHPALLWQCSKGLNDCAGCPRFQAYRQGLATGKQGLQKLHVPLPADAVQPDVGDRHIKSTEIANVDGDGGRPIDAGGARDINTQPQTVVNPVAPSVHHTQNRPENGDDQSDRLNQTRVGIHSAPQKKLSWWKRSVLSFLFRHWRKAQAKESRAASALMTYASQFGQLDWAIKCVQGDPDSLWTQDHNGLSHPVNHRTAAPPNAAPTAPNAPFTSAPNQPLSDAMQSPSDAAKHSNDQRN